MSEKDKIIDLAVRKYRIALKEYIELADTDKEQLDEDGRKQYHRNLGGFACICDHTPLLKSEELVEELEQQGDSEGDSE